MYVYICFYKMLYLHLQLSVCSFPCHVWVPEGIHKLTMGQNPVESLGSHIDIKLAGSLSESRVW